MQHIDYIEAQAQLAKTMRRVCESEQPLAIDGAGKDRVVMLPFEVFQQLQVLQRMSAQCEKQQLNTALDTSPAEPL